MCLMPFVTNVRIASSSTAYKTYYLYVYKFPLPAYFEVASAAEKAASQ